MLNNDMENLYGNHNKLVVGRDGKLTLIHWEHGAATDYHVIGINEKQNFVLRKVKAVE